jgi:hypothetical protein
MGETKERSAPTLWADRYKYIEGGYVDTREIAFPVHKRTVMLNVPFVGQGEDMVWQLSRASLSTRCGVVEGFRLEAGLPA